MSGDGADNQTDGKERIIRIAQRNSRDSWQPLCDWPHQTFVQWGRTGFVFSRTGNYQTAFFEAFIDNDPDVGFIRGEGEDLAAAEANAWARYRNAKECRHIWGRRGYLNGVGVCLRCGHLKANVFKQVPVLGAWREPLSSSELSIISMGSVDGDPVPGEEEFIAKLRLRARRAGLFLPSRKKVTQGIPETEASEAFYMACRDVLAAWLATNGLPKSAGTGLQGLFDRISGAGLKDILSEKEKKGVQC